MTAIARTNVMRSPLLLLVTLLFISITPSLAFFEHLFNQQQGQPQHQAPSINWEDQFSASAFPVLSQSFSFLSLTLNDPFISSLSRVAQCPTYLCKDSLVCVDKPKDCPCPYEKLDKKCLIPGSEGDFVCARDCEMVERAARG
jgi:hypothetical protein